MADCNDSGRTRRPEAADAGPPSLTAASTAEALPAAASPGAEGGAAAARYASAAMGDSVMPDNVRSGTMWACTVRRPSGSRVCTSSVAGSPGMTDRSVPRATANTVKGAGDVGAASSWAMTTAAPSPPSDARSVLATQASAAAACKSEAPSNGASLQPSVGTARRCCVGNIRTTPKAASAIGRHASHSPPSSASSTVPR